MNDPHNAHRSVLTEEQLAPILPGAGSLTFTRWLMLLELNLRLCWRFYAVLALFLSLAWFDLLAVLPSLLHLLVLALFTVLALHTLWGTQAGWRLPPRAAAARRLETANALPHHPYEALTAKPINQTQDSALKTVWHHHQERARARLTQLRLPRPQFSIAGTDPYHLRLGLGLLLVLALLDGRHELGARLHRALTPNTTAPAPLGSTAKITAWVTPPAYTGLPPLLLAESGKSTERKTSRIPAGSQLALRVHESASQPRLVSAAGEQELTLTGEQSYTLDTPIMPTSTLQLKAGWFTLANWPVEVVPDASPQITWQTPPTFDKTQKLALDYQASDDYGIAQIQLVLNLAVSAPGLPTAPEVLPLNGVGQKQVTQKTTLDLSASQWSGMPVTVVAEATDQSGQITRTASMILTLPERQFSHPLAKELAAMRRNLLRDAAKFWQPTIKLLLTRAQEPPRYKGDPRILLGLRATAARMHRHTPQTQLTSVATLLWQMAMHLDGGGKAEAEAQLRTAQQELEQALANKADAGTIAEKTAALQQALANYMQEMARNLPPDAQDIPQDILDEAGQNLAEDLMQKLKEIEDLAATGSAEAAQQKLQELQKMLDEMRQMQPMSAEQKADLQTLKQMRELIEKQEKLQEQTGQAAQQEQEPQPGQQSAAPQAQTPPPASPVPQEFLDQAPPDSATQVPTNPTNNGAPQDGQAGAAQQQPEGNTPTGLAERQGELRRELGKMVEDMANRQTEPPPQLGTADQGMKAAGDKLGQEDLAGAKQEQNKTLDALKDLAGQMKQQLQSKLMMLPSGGSGGKAENRDPFSRSDKDDARGAINGDVVVPEQQETQRARKILDELRRRSSEYERPKDERSYIERLLNKF